MSFIIAHIVPITPTLFPAASSILFIIYDVDVFPQVPVMPIVVSFLAGYSKYAADMNANALLDDFTLITVTSSFISTSLSITITFAPLFIASGINLCESTVVPIVAINKSLSLTLLEFSLISFISIEIFPFINSYSTFSKSSDKFIIYLLLHLVY